LDGECVPFFPGKKNEIRQGWKKEGYIFAEDVLENVSGLY
jgi:hypothetical protein